jgi:hypothetical protein
MKQPSGTGSASIDFHFPRTTDSVLFQLLSLEVFDECLKIFNRELFKLRVSGNRTFQQLLQQLNLTNQPTTQQPADALSGRPVCPASDLQGQAGRTIAAAQRRQGNRVFTRICG